MNYTQFCEVTTEVMRILCWTLYIVNCIRVHKASEAEADAETSLITNVL